MAQWLSLFLSTFLLSSFLIDTIDGQITATVLPKCGWELKLKTGDEAFADTRAKIDMEVLPTPLFAYLGSFMIKNLSNYGKQGPGYSYFQRGQRDTFLFEVPCYPGVCNVTFYSDGTGSQPGWFLESADLAIGPPGIPPSYDVLGRWTGRNATVNRWLSVVDPPYSLNVTVNFCS